MLFLTYYELNENMPGEERRKAVQKVLSSGQFPPKGVKIIRWDGTPDMWGILLVEAESVEDVHKALGIWRDAGDGFFKLTKTAPAMPVQEEIAMHQEIAKALGSA